MNFQCNIFSKLTAISAALLLSSAASAVTVSSDSRFVQIVGEVSSYNSSEYWRRGEFAPSAAVNFTHDLAEDKSINNNRSVTNASISSSMFTSDTTALFTGSGSAYSWSGAEQEDNPRFRSMLANARSEQTFAFTIEEDTNFALSGSLSYAMLDDGFLQGGVFFSLRDTRYSGGSFDLTMGARSYFGGDFSKNMLMSGLLEAGTYYLNVYAFTDVGFYTSYAPGLEEAIANYDFELALGGSYTHPSAVPVPAAAWLFGSALLGLVGVKRKK